MLSALPASTHDFMDWPWEKIAPYFNALAERPLDEGTVDAWLSDWSRLSELIYETFQRLYVATTVDTTDKRADERFNNFLDNIYPHWEAAEQRLKEKLLSSELEPDGFDVPLQAMRADAELFREANLPLLARQMKLSNEYDRIAGAQTVEWQGKNRTVDEMRAVLLDPDREVRERAWRLTIGRQLADRTAINELWRQLLDLRIQIAANTGMKDFRAYRWQELHRFDYTPEDNLEFLDAIESVAVPAATRLYERRRARLGVESLRPWDKFLDPDNRAPLRPYQTIDELEVKTSAIFHRVDPQLGGYFEIMRREGLLDLENRVGKAPGGYCTEFPVERRPFIFTNAVGTHEDVQTLLHEGGHSFHVFESAHLPYFQQLATPMEFAEVASMGMELLAAPFLTQSEGGFYSQADAARARLENLEASLLFWPYMAVVDAFQHWVYEHTADARDTDRCDTVWGELWDRYMPGEDWSGLEDEKITGWQRKLHITQSPLYYVEYGLALLGSVLIWRNARRDYPAAVAAYRRALSLGGTASLPELFSAAGVRFAFDAETLREAVEVIETEIERLEVSNGQS
jgi:oligoendopeptidase F